MTIIRNQTEFKELISNANGFVNNINFDDFIIKNCVIENIIFFNCIFCEIIFKYCIFKNCVINNSVFRKSHFNYNNINGLKIFSTRIIDIEIRDTKIKNMIFLSSICEFVSLSLSKEYKNILQLDSNIYCLYISDFKYIAHLAFYIKNNILFKSHFFHKHDFTHILKNLDNNYKYPIILDTGNIYNTQSFNYNIKYMSGKDIKKELKINSTLKYILE